MPAVTSCLSGTRPKRQYTHTYLRRGFARLGATDP